MLNWLDLVLKSGGPASRSFASDVKKELLRRDWTLKDFKHVSPALEHLFALEVLERERKPGRKAKWLFRKAKNFREIILMA